MLVKPKRIVAHSLTAHVSYMSLLGDWINLISLCIHGRSDCFAFCFKPLNWRLFETSSTLTADFAPCGSRCWTSFNVTNKRDGFVHHRRKVCFGYGSGDAGRCWQQKEQGFHFRWMRDQHIFRPEKLEPFPFPLKIGEIYKELDNHAKLGSKL